MNGTPINLLRTCIHLNKTLLNLPYSYYDLRSTTEW